MTTQRQDPDVPVTVRRAMPGADAYAGSARQTSSADDLRVLAAQLDLLAPVVADLLGLRADIDRALARFEAFQARSGGEVTR